MATPFFEGLSLSPHVGTEEVEALSAQVYGMSEEVVLQGMVFHDDPEVPGYYLVPEGKVMVSVSRADLIETARARKLGELYTKVHEHRVGKMSRYVTDRMQTSGGQAVA